MKQFIILYCFSIIINVFVLLDVSSCTGDEWIPNSSLLRLLSLIVPVYALFAYFLAICGVLALAASPFLFVGEPLFNKIMKKQNGEKQSNVSKNNKRNHR